MRRRNAPHEEEQQHRQMLLRPPDKSFKQKFRDFFWDSEKHTCLTRTPLNWSSITIYYIIFLSVIILMFSLALLIIDFLENKGTPRYILDESPLGGTPSLNFFPLENTRSLIWLSSKRSYKSYVNTINEVFSTYKKANKSFNVSDFGECAQPPFGYDTMAPCIFFRLNRLIMWKPIPYTSNDSLSKDMPNEVKQLITDSPIPRVWMSCHGATAKDRDHLSPEFFKFQGTKGFDISPFPFNRQKNFVDPIVALKLNKTQHERILFSFMCFAWAKKMNIKKTKVDVNLYFE